MSSWMPLPWNASAASTITVHEALRIEPSRAREQLREPLVAEQAVRTAPLGDAVGEADERVAGTERDDHIGMHDLGQDAEQRTPARHGRDRPVGAHDQRRRVPRTGQHEARAVRADADAAVEDGAEAPVVDLAQDRRR